MASILPKNALSRPSAPARLRNVLAQRGQATVAELAADSGLSRSAASAALTRLIASGEVDRLGRGLVAVAGGRAQPQGLRLGSAAGEILEALREAGVPALLTGYDVLASLGNQLPVEWPHLVLVERGAGQWAADILRSADFAAVVEPSRDQLDLLVELHQERIVILRERSIRTDAAAVRPVEEAWVDLVAEQRAGYPIATSELSELLSGLAGIGVSWTRLVRAARRRSLPLQLDPHAAPVPLTIEARARNTPLARIVPAR